MSSTLFSLPRVAKEMRELWALSLPIIIAQLAAAGMTFVDVSMSGQYSSLDLAAVAIGSSFWTPVYMLVRGVLMAMTPITAQLYGAGELDQIAAKTRQGAWIALLLSFVCVWVVINPGVLFDAMGVEPRIAALSEQYLIALSWSLPGMCLYQLMASYCEGLSDTRTPMIISVFAVLLNIPANYILIYGKFGFPALGAVGCGYATALCFWVMAVLLGLYLRFGARHKRTQPFTRFEWPNKGDIGAHLKVGVPVGMALFVEVSIFSVIALMVGDMGVSVVAGHQVALNLASLVYIIPVSLAAGITIMVGQSLGRGHANKAAYTSLISILAIILLSGILATFIVMFSESIAGIYSQDAAVIALAAELLMFAALFQLVDGVQLGSVGALRGYKDTRAAMIYMMIACWLVALPLGYTLALTSHLTAEPMGPHGFWIGLVTALTIAAILTSVRLWNTCRRTMQNCGQTLC
ncbi:MATE family efflux transporter [Parendozoicomonas haliclonae]|uniref:Multidrug-efflux transporter n=1 Tax=Parendozoicomonas haliclonae TaxID=1960125 RepID=A0A1X7AR05_9GAMM|nr:MATE family efflux transporter [Parendozoicomonas haliclonae]SMA49837.1 Multidrug resistance protein MdtK [Parendozoicomonas haliclonae]